MEVVPVAGGHDWRLDRLRAAGAWFSPIDADNEAQFDALWRDMLGRDLEIGATLEVLGRNQHWPRAAGGLLRAHLRQPVCPGPGSGRLHRHCVEIPHRLH